MRTVARILSAGAVAGAISLGTSPGGGPLAAPGAGSGPVAKQAAREDVFEFTQKPAVKKEGDQWVITFASKGKCDATVAVVNKDGKVVRHLASGVLGANAPWPFKQNALAQSLEWDGKDDGGKPAPAGCRVKVSLGLKPTYEKSFADPFTFNMKEGIGMAVDRDGNLCVVQNGTVRRFTREGAYNRTLLPPQAGATPGTFAGRPWAETTWGEHVMVGAWLRGPFPNFLAGGNPVGTPVVGPDGRFAVLFNKKDNRVLTQLHLFGQDGSLPAASSILFGNHRNGYISGRYSAHAAFTGGGTNHLAVSPDGGRVAPAAGWLYVSGYGDAVLRYRWKDLKGPRMEAKVFKGEYEKSGSDNEHFHLPSGVACDAEGNVYVADNGNHRIQVYRPDGAFLRTVQVKAPHRIAVHPKTGDIYALCWRSGKLEPKEKVTPQLVKITKDGRVAAAVELKAHWYFWHYPWATMALDWAAEAPAVWLADKDGIRKLADKGNAFEEVLRLGADVDKSIYVGTPGDSRVRAVVDPVREELYLGLSGGGPFTRIDGRTGKIDPTWKVRAANLAVGPDGRIYARILGFGRFIARYDHDGKEVPFPKGVECRDPWRNVLATGAIYTGCNHWSNVWQSGFDVSPTGEIAASVHEICGSFLKALYPGDARVPVSQLNLAELSKAQRGKNEFPAALAERGFKRYGAFTLVEIWNPDGSEKCIAAFENPTRGSGLRIDAQGSLYLANCFTFPGRKGLESLKPGQRTHTGAGSLFKLGSRGGKWPLARAVPKGGDPGLPGVTLEYRNWTIGGAAWAVQDAADTFGEQSCGCGHVRFDLDGFARSWLPANHIRSVLVYDANGNRILRVGRYGNADCAGPESLVPDPDLGFCWVHAVAVSDEALYAVDTGNRRTVRALLGYEAEETVDLP